MRSTSPSSSHPTERPNYVAGVISHGVTLRKSFDIKHTGSAAKSLDLVPQSTQKTTDKNPTNYLLDPIPLSPHLHATAYNSKRS